MENIVFNHKKLDVYQNSIEFVAWLSLQLENIRGNKNIVDQINRCLISVPLNIAEGNGKSSKKDHSRFLEIARSSALECTACLDVMFAKKVISKETQMEGKGKLFKIVNMLYKLSASLLGNRLAS